LPPSQKSWLKKKKSSQALRFQFRPENCLHSFFTHLILMWFDSFGRLLVETLRERHRPKIPLH
jgi:hypothetical protein